MGYVSVDVDVDMDDILWSLSSYEKQQLVDDLYDDGYTPKKLEKELDPPSHAAEFEFNEALNKLKGKWNMLTAEEEQIIIKISKRF